MTDWQPIETAPRDGSHFLAGDGRKFKAYGGSVCCRWNDTFSQFETVPGKWCVGPTHWMPLPEPPK